MSSTVAIHRELVSHQMRARNTVTEAFFAREAERLARLCRQMSDRFQRGGRLLAFGRGPSTSDAQHGAVEFVHPVLVGKRALPALDLSIAFREWVPAVRALGGHRIRSSAGDARSISRSATRCRAAHYRSRCRERRETIARSDVGRRSFAASGLTR